MSWQLFTLVQIGAFALAAIAALLLRIRGLRRRNDQLVSLCSQAHEELVNVTGKLTEIETTASPEQLLTERAKTLVGDDVIVTLRRLVLENEIEPSSDFTLKLSEYLRSHSAAPDPEPEPVPGVDGSSVGSEEEFARRWRSIREECQQLAMFLVAEQPDFLPAVHQLFEVLEPLDRAYYIDLPPVQLPHASAEADGPEHDAMDDQAGGQATAVDPGVDDADADMDQAALDALLADVESGPAREPSRSDTTDEVVDTEPAAAAEPTDLDPARTGTG